MPLVLSQPSFGANLDAPATAKPTIRTELKRGHEIAFNCGLHAKTNIEALDHCIDDASLTQARQGTATEAFPLVFILQL